RKAVGGGMRQAGIIAAAGVYALENMVDRLAEDHENARFLAGELAKLPGVRLDPSSVQTNIVIWEMEDISAPDFSKKLREQALLVTTLGPTRLRMVTHYGIERSHIEDALERLQQTIAVAV
ncbi:MAG TPA: beta-eliminating lyase-related protein, partial [Dehalococcoidia bacterium]|nr:beta-eliminating lyase-related protein [Dehalococcoidia bacterium]